MAAPARVYTYAKCSTCRKAVAWLRAQKVAFVEVPIVEQPPSIAELGTMLSRVDGVRRLFNTSGEQYREQKIAERLSGGMSDDEAIALLAQHGKLIKRPFLLSGRVGLVGFKEEAWAAALL